MRHTAIAFTILLLAPLGALRAADTPNPVKPNIVFVIADDKHYQRELESSFAHEMPAFRNHGSQFQIWGNCGQMPSVQAN